MFELQNQIFQPLNLIQVIQLKNWRRIVTNTIRESVLEHIYVNDQSLVSVINSIEPLIGGHTINIFNINGKNIPQKQQSKEIGPYI